MSTRLQRLQERIEDPLLVTTEANVFYLTGFESSNAALLVERDRTRLFTDFRYAESARQVPDVEFGQVKRNVYGALAEMLEGRIAFEAAGITYDRWETLRGGGLELVPTRGVVEALRAVKDERELDAIRRATEITNRAYERISEERFLGRSEKDLSRAVIYGSVMGSFCCEMFGVTRFETLTRAEIDARFREFREFTEF